MLFVHESFRVHAGLQYDGLLQDAYEGAVYGDPPFDGRYDKKDTLNLTLAAAEYASVEKRGFRG
eukprot:8158326-Pyramimonas_sp.AAC.1